MLIHSHLFISKVLSARANTHVIHDRRFLGIAVLRVVAVGVTLEEPGLHFQHKCVVLRKVAPGIEFEEILLQLLGLLLVLVERLAGQPAPPSRILASDGQAFEIPRSSR